MSNRITELITQIRELPDRPTLEEGECHMQRYGTTSVRVWSYRVRPLTAAGIPRNLITSRTSYHRVNQGRSRFPDTVYDLEVEVPHNTSADSRNCICGCNELTNELYAELQNEGFNVNWGGRTHWLDRWINNGGATPLNYLEGNTSQSTSTPCVAQT